ncbi:MAG: hypothetical protein AB7F43_14005 [Bacteriovoracia bacterium]
MHFLGIRFIICSVLFFLTFPVVHAKIYTNEQIADFREELLCAQKRHQRSQSPYANYHHEIGTESKALSPRVAQDGHILYIGSGADTFGAFYDFPLARYIHLIDDVLIKFENIFGEISARLKALSSDARVEIVSLGYASKISARVIERERKRDPLKRFLIQDSFGAYIMGDDEKAQNPMILRVSWTSKALGPQERFIYLHPLVYADDYVFRPKNITTSFRVVLNTIPEDQRLVGILTFGAPMPVSKEMLILWERLTKGGRISYRKYNEPDEPFDFNDPDEQFLKKLPRGSAEILTTAQYNIHGCRGLLRKVLPVVIIKKTD